MRASSHRAVLLSLSANDGARHFPSTVLPPPRHSLKSFPNPSSVQLCGHIWQHTAFDLLVCLWAGGRQRFAISHTRSACVIPRAGLRPPREEPHAIVHALKKWEKVASAQRHRPAARHRVDARRRWKKKKLCGCELFLKVRHFLTVFTP